MSFGNTGKCEASRANNSFRKLRHWVLMKHGCDTQNATLWDPVLVVCLLEFSGEECCHRPMWLVLCTLTTSVSFGPVGMPGESLGSPTYQANHQGTQVFYDLQTQIEMEVNSMFNSISFLYEQRRSRRVWLCFLRCHAENKAHALCCSLLIRRLCRKPQNQVGPAAVAEARAEALTISHTISVQEC